MNPVPDPLLRKYGSAGNRTQDLSICSQELWPPDNRGCLNNNNKFLLIYWANIFAYLSVIYLMTLWITQAVLYVLNHGNPALFMEAVTSKVEDQHILESSGYAGTQDLCVDPWYLGSRPDCTERIGLEKRRPSLLTVNQQSEEVSRELVEEMCASITGKVTVSISTILESVATRYFSEERLMVPENRVLKKIFWTADWWNNSRLEKIAWGGAS
jgi:hypothetical protein